MLSVRVWNIAFRTVHLAAMGILLGGHAFDLERSRLVPSLVVCAISGIILGLLEAGPSLLWFHQGRGLMTLAKVCLLFAVPFLWNSWYYRLAVLLGVVVLASVGSHMPARFRYYSVIYRQVIPNHSGPRTGQLMDESTPPAVCESDTE